MALVSVSRCSSDFRSSVGVFVATSGATLSFLGACAAGAFSGATFAGAFAPGASALAALRVVVAGGAAGAAAAAAATSLFVAPGGGVWLGDGAGLATGGAASATAGGAELCGCALGGCGLTPAQPAVTRMQSSPAIAAMRMNCASVRFATEPRLIRPPGFPVTTEWYRHFQVM